MKTSSINSTLKFFSIFLFVILLLFSHACDSGNPVSINPDDGVNWKIGNKKDYNITGTQKTEINDTISGLKFIFPDGGNGTLTVAPVTSGPEIQGIDSKKFFLNYSGTEKVQIKIEYKGTDIVNLFYYGIIEGAAIDKSAGNKGWWTCIESDTSDNYLVFDVSLKPISITCKKGKGAEIQAYSPPKSNYFALTTMTENSGQWTKMQTYKQTVNQVIDLWLNNMSETLKENCRKLINGDLKYDIRVSDGNSYQAFNNIFVGKNAVFNLKLNNMTGNEGLHAISHEVGHYMTHVLCGYDRYMDIYGRIPQQYWGLGGSIEHSLGLYLEGRKYVLEEYAFFSEVLATGDANVDMLSVTPPTLCDQVDSPHNPNIKDYPSHEGFGMSVIGALMRSPAQDRVSLFDYEAGKGMRREFVKVPVIDAPVCDIIGYVWQKGPREINELMQYVQEYLDSRGGEDKYKLSAMLEPIGWSYNGTGTIVDKDNKPMEKCAVQNISQVGGTQKIEEYRTPMSAYTGKDGKFILKRLYGGSSILRVFSNYESGKYKDSTDFPLTIDWIKPTNQSIDMKTLTLTQGTILDSIKNCKKVTIDFDTYGKWANGDSANLFEGDGSGIFFLNHIRYTDTLKGTNTWAGNNFSHYYKDEYIEQSITLKFNTDGTIIEGIIDYNDGNGTWVYHLEIQNVPVSDYYENSKYEWDYDGFDDDMTKYVVKLTAIEPDLGELKSYYEQYTEFDIEFFK